MRAGRRLRALGLTHWKIFICRDQESNNIVVFRIDPKSGRLTIPAKQSMYRLLLASYFWRPSSLENSCAS